MLLRILLIVDVSNIYYTVRREFNGQLDYKNLYDRVAERGQIYRAIAYGSDMNDEARRFKDLLINIGFELKYKEPKIYPNAEDPTKEYRKADWDVQMAIDIVQILDSVDLVVLVTGDGDLVPAVNYVKSRGKLIHILGCGISRDLREASDLWFEIDKTMLDRPKRKVINAQDYAPTIVDVSSSEDSGPDTTVGEPERRDNEQGGASAGPPSEQLSA